MKQKMLPVEEKKGEMKKKKNTINREKKWRDGKKGTR